MARLRRYLNFLNGWEQVGAAVEAHAAELPHLEMLRPKLQEFLDQARSLSVQQSAFTATKQDTSKRLRRVMRLGQALVALLRNGAREHFGPSSETLIEFGMQPFRGRPREDTPPETPNPETPESPTPTPIPE